MENTINTRISNVINASNKNVREFAKIAGIPQTTLNEAATMNKDIRVSLIQKIANAYPEISLDWLISGKGDMYKNNTAGRDNNVVEGDNKGVIGNTGSIGSMVADNSGNYVSMGDHKAKKLLKDGEMHIEMEQSTEVELLKQTNIHLETRIKDLEKMNTLQSKTIEAMQLLIDTLTKK